MVGIDDVINKLSTVIDPDLNKDIVSMGMIKDLDLNSGNVINANHSAKFVSTLFKDKWI